MPESELMVSYRKPAQGVESQAHAGKAFEQHRQALQHFFSRRVKQSEDAKDLLQEVFVRLLSVSQETLVRNPQAYLYGIAGHVFREFLRRKKRNPVSFDSEVLEIACSREDELAGGHFVDGPALEKQVQEALIQLPPTHLNVLLAERRDGLTVEQIAEKYGLSSHTVKKYIVQSLVRIREVWDQKAD